MSQIERPPEWRRLDALLAGMLATRVIDDPEAFLAARVKLGTASLGEKLRYYLRLGPSAAMRRECAQNKRLHEQWLALARMFLTKVT